MPFRVRAPSCHLTCEVITILTNGLFKLIALAILMGSLSPAVAGRGLRLILIGYRQVKKGRLNYDSVCRATTRHYFTLANLAC